MFRSSRTPAWIAGLITLAVLTLIQPPLRDAGVLEAQTTRTGALTLIESGARTASFNGNTFTNTAAKGATFNLNVTAASGTTPTLDVKLQWMDPVTSTWSDLTGAVFQRITAAGNRTLTIYPAAEPRGTLRIILGTDQPAGSEVSETVTADKRWRLISLACTLSTSAVAGGRQPALFVDDGAGTIPMQVGNSTSTAASGGALSTWSSFGTSGGLGNGNIGPLPNDLVLLGGWRIRTSTVAFDVGDNWNSPKLLVEEWSGNYAGTALPRFIRAVATIAGTTPSFTFSVAGAALQ